MTSVTQSANDLHEKNASWWLVGKFIQGQGNGSPLKWQSCKSNCYSNSRMTPFNLQANDLLDSSIQLKDVTVAIFSEYPTDYQSCEESSTCGTRVLNPWNPRITSGRSPLYVPLDVPILVVVTMDGYFTSYITLNVVEAGALVETNMLRTMAVGQNRITLDWEHSGDLDLWIDAMWGSGDWDYIGWQTPDKSADDGELTKVNLDLDSTDGSEGPETTSLENILSGTYEVWINAYNISGEGKFTKDLVRSTPAIINVFCNSSLDDQGILRTGRLYTIIQSPDTIPSDGVSWWKVGQFISQNGPSSLHW